MGMRDEDRNRDRGRDRDRDKGKEGPATAVPDASSLAPGAGSSY